MRKKCKHMMSKIEGMPAAAKAIILDLYRKNYAYREIEGALKDAGHIASKSMIQRWCVANMIGGAEQRDTTQPDESLYPADTQGQQTAADTMMVNPRTMPVATQRERVYRFKTDADCKSGGIGYTARHIQALFAELPVGNIAQWLSRGLLTCHTSSRGSSSLNIFDVDQVIYVAVVLRMSQMGMLDKRLDAKIIEPIDTFAKDLKYPLTEPAKIIQVFRNYKWNACLVGTYTTTTAKFTAKRNKTAQQQLSLTLHQHASLMKELPFRGGHRYGTDRGAFAVLNLKAISDRVISALAGEDGVVFRDHQKHEKINAAPAQENPTASTPIDKRHPNCIALLDKTTDANLAAVRKWRKQGYSYGDIAVKLEKLGKPSLKISKVTVSKWCRANGVHGNGRVAIVTRRQQPRSLAQVPPRPTRFRVIMEDEGLSIIDVAQLTGLSFFTLHKVLGGRYSGTAPVVSKALAGLFGPEWTLAKLMEPVE